MQPALCLPAQPPLASGVCRRLRCFSAGGVTIGLVICGFWLFIYFSSLLCCPLCFQGSAQIRQWEGFLVFGNFSLFKTPFPGRNSIPPSFVSFFVFYIFFLPPFEDLGCFSGCLMSSVGIQKLFCGIYSAFKCSFDEFVGEKVFSPSYSSAILAPPQGWLLKSNFSYLSSNKLQSFLGNAHRGCIVDRGTPWKLLDF